MKLKSNPNRTRTRTRTKTRTRRPTKGVVARIEKDNKVLVVTDEANSTFVQAATRTWSAEEAEEEKGGNK